jgi:hypothetical protein
MAAKMRTAMISQIILSLSMSGLGAKILDGSNPVPDYATSEAGNPFVEGWYADPDTAIYNGMYWIYPTSPYPCKSTGLESSLFSRPPKK